MSTIITNQVDSSAGPDGIGTLDLNQIFHLNLSYNFDLLKTVLDGILKTQKSQQQEINDLKNQNKDLKNQILNLKIAGEKDPNIIKQLKEEEKEQKKETSSSPVTEFIKVKPIQPITDGIKLDSSNDYDEITNKLIKKINSIENYVNDIYNNTKNLPQNVSENTNKIAYHDKLIQNINQKLDELKLITDDHEKKINDMGIKLQDFNIYDILKGNLQGDGDSSAAIALIQNLEKKVDSKFKLNDDRINKHDEELFKLTKDVTNIKNAQDLINRNLDTIKKRLDDIDKKIEELFSKLNDLENNFNDNIDGRIKNLEKLLNSKLEELETLFNEQIKGIGDANGKNSGDDNQGNLDGDANQKLKDLAKRITDIEKAIKLLSVNLGIDGIKSDIQAIKSALMQKCSQQDFQELKDQLIEFQKQLNYFKSQFEDFISNQTDHDDIQNIKRKLESLTNKVHDLASNEQDNQNNASKSISKHQNIVDNNKYLEIGIFKEFKEQVIKEFNNVNENFAQIRRLIDDIVATLKQKTTFKDLKALEDDLLAKLEELRIACSRKFADKVETNKNIKYLDQQIKHITQVYIKKMEKGDNWLLAKKPLNGNLCASCESYIGDLKENNTYVPWNKYPMRDPNDKLYRLGNGFSKMLQMIQVDENEKLNNFATTNNFYDMKGGRTEGNRDNSLPKDKQLPKISQKRKVSISDEGENNADDDVHEDEQNQPKITKIYRINKPE